MCTTLSCFIMTLNCSSPFLTYTCICLFQSSLVGVCVPDPDVLPGYCKSNLNASGSLEDLVKNPVSNHDYIHSTLCSFIEMFSCFMLAYVAKFSIFIFYGPTEYGSRVLSFTALRLYILSVLIFVC